METDEPKHLRNQLRWLYEFIVEYASNRAAVHFVRFGRKFAMREKTDIHPSHSAIKSYFSMSGTDIPAKWLCRLIGHRRSLPFTLIFPRHFTPDYCFWSSYHKLRKLQRAMSYSLYEEYYYPVHPDLHVWTCLLFIIPFYTQTRVFRSNEYSLALLRERHSRRGDHDIQVFLVISWKRAGRHFLLL